MLERSLRFSHGQRHIWQQFCLVLQIQGNHYRSLITAKEVEHGTNKADFSLVKAVSYLKQFPRFNEAKKWLKKAHDTQDAKSVGYLRARCHAYLGATFLIAATGGAGFESGFGIRDKQDSLRKSLELFKMARAADPEDHLVDFYIAYHAAFAARKVDR